MKNGDKTPIRIVVVEPRGQGGMIHYAYQLCRGLATQGAEVTLITSTQYELGQLSHNFTVERFLRLWDTTPAKYQASNFIPRFAFKVFRSTRRTLRGIKYVLEWARLTRQLHRMDADILQFGKIEFSLEAIFLAWLRKRGHLLTQIGHEFEARESGRTPWAKAASSLDHLIYDNFDLIFFHALSNMERFLTLYSPKAARYEIIPHGNEGMFTEAGINQEVKADLIKKYGLKKDETAILFFGLLAPSKGIPDLVRAYALVKKKGNASKLIIAGAASKHFNLDELKDLISELNLWDSIFLDTRYLPINHVGALMDLASFVVYPYTSSTQSGSLQVAYAFGKPVISTNAGGLPEVVEEGKSGLVVPVSDPEAISRAILRMINHPKETIRMGEYARHLSATKFSWEGIAQQILDNYQDLLSK